MPRTVETVVYPIGELPEAAKDSARAWYRGTCLDHEWYDAVFEDFETICRILGVTLRTSPVRLFGGGTREKPHQRRNFYQLTAVIRTRGNYCHEHSMAIEVERDSPTWQPPTDGAEDTVIEALRDLARWLYRQLEREYDYLTSDAAVDETIAVNGWTFTAEGRRFG